MALLADYRLKIVNKENMHFSFYYCASIFKDNESKQIGLVHASKHTHTKNMGLNVICIRRNKDLDKRAQIKKWGKSTQPSGPTCLS